MSVVSRIVRPVVLTAALMLTACVPAVAVEATLIADAHVNSARPTANSGSISNLNVGGGYTTLLQFDLTTLPSGTTSSQISRALLRLYCNRADTPGLVSVQPVSSAWGEYSVTYATLPSLGSASQVVSVAQEGNYVWVDVTSLVQGWVTTSSTNNGFALTAGSANVQFDSKENDLTGHAPLLDIVLATQGPMGPRGDTGATGPAGSIGPVGIAGSVGPAGATGPAGPQGVKGDAGAQGLVGPSGATGPVGAAGPIGPLGPQGLTGPQGPQGVQGLAGPQGPAVANYTGNYSSTTNYARNDAVSYNGSTYISLIPGSVGNTPDQSPSQWAVLAAQGPAGPAGATGVQGAAGPVGPTGPAGAMGPQGPPLSFGGGWLTSRSYAVGDAVSYGGGSYIALVANSARQPDVSPAYWAVLSQAGVAGTPGVTGAQGPQGTRGPAGVSYKGAWSPSMGYVANDAVFYAGSTYLALATSFGTPPDTAPTVWALLSQAGSAGATGPAGTAATIGIGSVTTGAAGTQATVTNSGTSSAAVLNFTIPQGAAGTSGSGGGGSGTSGVPFASMYHAVSFNTVYYSVNNTNASATETAQVFTWIPASCTASTLMVYSQQSNTIAVTLRTGTPGAMTNSSLSCSVASNSGCTSTGAVAVPAGSFIDLIMTGASGTSAGVWTAVNCN